MVSKARVFGMVFVLLVGLSAASYAGTHHRYQKGVLDINLHGADLAVLKSEIEADIKVALSPYRPVRLTQLNLLNLQTPEDYKNAIEIVNWLNQDWRATVERIDLGLRRPNDELEEALYQAIYTIWPVPSAAVASVQSPVYHMEQSQWDSLRQRVRGVETVDDTVLRVRAMPYIRAMRTGAFRFSRIAGTPERVGIRDFKQLTPQIVEDLQSIAPYLNIDVIVIDTTGMDPALARSLILAFRRALYTQMELMLEGVGRISVTRDHQHPASHSAATLTRMSSSSSSSSSSVSSSIIADLVDGSLAYGAVNVLLNTDFNNMELLQQMLEAIGDADDIRVVHVYPNALEIEKAITAACHGCRGYSVVKLLKLAGVRRWESLERPTLTALIDAFDQLMPRDLVFMRNEQTGGWITTINVDQMRPETPSLLGQILPHIEVEEANIDGRPEALEALIRLYENARFGRMNVRATDVGEFTWTRENENQRNIVVASLYEQLTSPEPLRSILRLFGTIAHLTVNATAPHHTIEQLTRALRPERINTILELIINGQIVRAPAPPEPVVVPVLQLEPTRPLRQADLAAVLSPRPRGPIRGILSNLLNGTLGSPRSPAGGSGRR